MASKSVSLEKQLDDLWKDKGDVITLPTKNVKYILMSDMHMGDGSKSDDFRDNEDAVNRALSYYYEKGYVLILLGDVEELWQFSLDEVITRYEYTIYKSIKKFGDDRVHRIFGNHDIDWKINYDPIRNKTSNPYKAYEAIKLMDAEGTPRILLVHGHQGTVDSDKMSWISRPIVKAYGRGIEPMIKVDQATPAPRSPILQTFERERYMWAKKRRLMIICGHSHRAFFDSKSKVEKISSEIKALKKKIQFETDITNRAKLLNELLGKKQQVMDQSLLNGDYRSLGQNPTPNYFNTGCTLFLDGLTVIVIESDEIKLIKWHRNISTSPFEIQEKGNLSEFISKL